MAYSGKSEQRLASAVDYNGSKATLNSTATKEPAKMSDNGPKRLIGNLASGSMGKPLYGKQVSGSASGLTGAMSGEGFRNGPRWKKAIEPGEFKPGMRAQAKNTTRLNPGEGRSEPKMKVTGKAPKELRGGRVR